MAANSLACSVTLNEMYIIMEWNDKDSAFMSRRYLGRYDFSINILTASLEDNQVFRKCTDIKHVRFLRDLVYHANVENNTYKEKSLLLFEPFIKFCLIQYLVYLHELDTRHTPHPNIAGGHKIVSYTKFLRFQGRLYPPLMASASSDVFGRF